MESFTLKKESNRYTLNLPYKKHIPKRDIVEAICKSYDVESVSFNCMGRWYTDDVQMFVLDMNTNNPKPYLEVKGSIANRELVIISDR